MRVSFHSTICIIVLESRIEQIIIGNVTEAIIPAVGQARCILKHQGIPNGAYAYDKDKNAHLQ